MAKAKRKKSKLQPSQKKSSESLPKKSSPAEGSLHALRETLESIVIAFVLAFLFRTFEAEAFVIPTGSMSPSLQGMHKDVDCTECGHRFRTTASSEGGEQVQESIRLGHDPAVYDVMTGLCPMCRQPTLYRDDRLPEIQPQQFQQSPVKFQKSYPGDRILVNKYCYAFGDPERWDVVVFKFPGNGEMNYIKRLVGLPQETLRVFQGDVFVRPFGSDSEFEIVRKPPEKVLAMLQDVHDTDFEAATLRNAGWPLRWGAATGEGWTIEESTNDNVVEQKFLLDNPSEETSWIRYRHFVPGEKDWANARKLKQSNSETAKVKNELVAVPELISDFNPYNAHFMRQRFYSQSNSWQFEPHHYGVAWVSDLAVACEVEVQESQGRLDLDLVEAGKHFTCRIDLETGKAVLGIDGLSDYRPEAQTPVQSSKTYEILFANVDDQLLLWVDGELIDFGDTTFDFAKLAKDRFKLMPVTSEEDPGDLAPVGVGGRGTKLVVNRLKVLRDIYYLATNWEDDKNPFTYAPGQASFSIDYPLPSRVIISSTGKRLERLQSVRDLFRDPSTWERFADRHYRDFTLNEDQFFVMGDNSPESLDCRLWYEYRNGAKPGGAYLDRRLLIGKAVCVFWPHGWGSVPFLPKLPGFPNFGDMRLVR